MACAELTGSSNKPHKEKKQNPPPYHSLLLSTDHILIAGLPFQALPPHCYTVTLLTVTLLLHCYSSVGKDFSSGCAAALKGAKE